MDRGRAKWVRTDPNHVVDVAEACVLYDQAVCALSALPNVSGGGVMFSSRMYLYNHHHHQNLKLNLIAVVKPYASITV